MSFRPSLVLTLLVTAWFSVSALAADPSFLKVATVAASGNSHDLLKSPSGLAIVSGTGDLIVADTLHHRILRISPAGDVALLAGSGKPGYIDGAGAQAEFKEPSGVAVDSARELIYVADSGNHAIRTVTFTGTVATLAGSARPDDRDGAGRQSGFKFPHGLAIDSMGTIFIADTGNSRIRQVTPSGVVTTIAGDVHEGFADGAANSAQFRSPEGIAVGPDGALYISDTKNNVIRKLTNGTVSTIAGTGHPGFNDGGGPAAEFKEPSGIVCDEAGNVYVADVRNHAIRRISMVSSIDVTTIAGSAQPGFADGSVANATFRTPSGIAYAGALWVADTGNDAVRRIDAEIGVSAVNPNIGPASGGAPVHILGSGFVPGATQVRFGAVAATNVVYLTANELIVTAPAVTGVVDLTVTTPGGGATLPSAYSGVPPPAISTITPGKGKSIGGDPVIITGLNFTNDMTVMFGAAVASGLSLVSANSLTVVTPPGTAGAVDLTVTTIGGSAVRTAAFTYYAPPVITQFSPASGPAGTTVTITGSNFDTDTGATAVLLGTTPLPIASITPVQLVVSIPSSATTGRINVASTGGTTQSGSSFTVTVQGGGGGTLPPDPSLIATPVDIHSIADFNSTIRFLYTGSNAIQTGITAGAITDVFAAVIRGRALAADGTPLPGAKVTVHAHPEYGSTLTRADGRYDLVVNGGTTFTIDFTKSGYITAQRDAHVDRSDFAGTADVVLIAYDTASTAIAAGSDVAQFARGSRVEDNDGARQATLVFPAGTTATMTLPNGTTQSLQTLTVRATEYTVGALGPQRMPAPLPPQTGYTYAAEFSVDEAVAAGASEVQFSKPVAVYVDNFLHFPAGTIVPAGYYDRGIAAWVPSDNGRVIAVLSVAGGIATLDADGDGTADDALGIDEAERRQIATLYTAGTSLWRVPVTHFSPWDLNWGIWPPHDAIVPGAESGKSPSTEKLKDDACKVSGSIIECENQIVGEEIPIVGTPFSLHYESDRVEGRDTHYAISIPLTPHDVPTSMTSVELKVTVAGRTFTKSYSPAADLTDRIAWDGVDAYGRSLQGSRPATVEISYLYPAVYAVPIGGLRAWAQVVGPSASISTVPSRNGVAITRSWDFPVGGWRNPKDDLGGWTISPQHTYDWASKTILGGNGDRRTGATSAGSGLVLSQSFSFFSPNAVAYGPDGSLYLADNVAIRRVKPNATSATTVISLPGAVTSMAVDRDGSVYYSQSHRIFKVAPDGTSAVVAGNGATGNAIDGAAGPDSPLNAGSLALGVDGALYFLDIARIARLGRDGILRVVYQAPQSPEALVSPRDMTVDRDGNLIITDGALRIRKFDIKTGVLTTIAGTGCVPQIDFLCDARYDGDGGPALSAHLAGPNSVTAAPDGSIYFWDAGLVTTGGFNFFSVSVLRRLGPDSTITTEAVLRTDPGFFGSLTPSPNALSITANDLTFGPDGLLHIANASSTNIVHFGSVMAGFSATDTLVPNADGTRLFDFNSVGRLVKTIDTYTKATDYSFAYDTSGRLLRITDVNGRVTTVERSVSGVPSAIVSPDGARTTLAIGADGYLSSVQNPAGETATMTYFAGGLLKTFRDARGHTSTMTYDGSGRLLQDLSSSGSFTSASRSGDDRRFRVLRGTAGGRTWTYDIDHGSDNLVTQTTTAPDGTRSIQITNLPDLTTTLTTADGTVIKQRLTKEPRFGRQSPMLDSADVTTPSGLHLSLKHTRFVNKSSADPLSMTSSTDTTTVNGRSWTTQWDAATRVFAYTSPKGRTASVTVDSRGMPLSSRESTFTPVTFTYGSAGRLTRVAQGPRSLSTTYDSRGRIASVTDALNRTFTYTYDDADRLLTQQTPDGRLLAFTYDAGGNVTSIAPPSRPAHTFHYTDDALVDSYTPPTVPNGGVTTYAWTLDHQLHLITRPDGSTISFGYDAAGRATNIDAADDALTYTYTPAGAVASITNRSGSSIGFTWDGDLLTGVTSALGSVQFAYDSSFRFVRETLSGATAINYAYDDDDLLISAGALSLQRDAQTGLVSTSTIGIVSDTYSYDALGQESGHTVSVNGTPVITTTVTRDNGGRITQESDNFYGQQHAKVYSYDTPGHLAEATIDNAVAAHYEYDANGNRTLARSPSGDSTATYDAQDRLLAYGGSAYTYTPDGDIATKTDATGTSQYAYDAFGNLLSVKLPSKTITYEHDAANRRTGKLVDRVVVHRWIYSDDLKIIGELDGSGALVSRFVHATRVNVPEYMIRGLMTWRLVTDERGSVRAVINTVTGAVDQYLRYDEFGVVLEDSNPGFQPFGFAGGLYDPDASLVRFGARDYDPHTARWTSSDPLGFGGGQSNLYVYINSDPVNVIDPSGLSGTVTIYSSDNPGSSAPVWDGHSWIVYTPDGGSPTSYGTFGPMVQAPRGLNENWEINHWSDYANRTGDYDVVSRAVHIDDAHEAALMAVVERYKKLGEKAWSPTATCSTFANDAWQAATGESFATSAKSDNFPNPKRLSESIRKKNGGLGARRVH